MKRRLFTILSALSLLLCVAVVALWVRSFFVADYLRWERRGEGRSASVSIVTDSGALRVDLHSESREWSGQWSGDDATNVSRSTASPSLGWSKGLWFRFISGSQRLGVTYGHVSVSETYAVVPAWPFGLALGAL